MNLERVERIELSTKPWQGLGLPLHHTRIVAGISPASTEIYRLGVRDG